MGHFFSFSKSATNTALDASEWALLLFGLILTIGVLGEYKKFPTLLRASHATFELLVVIAIAGELFADGGVFLFSRHLQTISDGEFAAFNKEAGDARDRAAKAELQTAEIRREMADRTLALDATERSQLEQFPKQRFEIITYAGDREARKFSDLVAGALQSSGWSHLGTAPTGFDGTQPIFTGAKVEFSTRAGVHTQAAALSLSSVLSKERIVGAPAQRVVFPQDMNGRPPDIIRITVGVRKQAEDEATDRARLEAQAAELQHELIAQGPRYKLLGGKAGKHFRDSLRSFAGQKIDLRTALRSIDNPEIQTLKILLFAILSSSSLKWSPTLSEVDFVSPEVMVGRSGQATNATQRAAVALAKALGEAGLTDVNGRLLPPVEILGHNKGGGPPSDVVWLMIGAHMSAKNHSTIGANK
jgi:hypothetical protein